MKLSMKPFIFSLFTSFVVCMVIVIFGGCAGFQMAARGAEPIPLSDIIKSVIADGSNSTYNGQQVTITAAGRIYPSTAGEVPMLEVFTHHDAVRFFITDSDAQSMADHYYLNYMQSDLARIRGHTTYTFTLRIKDISEEITVQGDRVFTMWADMPARTVKADIGVIEATLDQIAAGGQKYVGKTVRLHATVSLDRLNELLGVQADVHPELVKTYSGAMLLATNDKDVVFWVVDDVAADGFFASNLERYADRQAYTFTLYVERIVTDGEQVEITTGIADD